MEHAAPLFILPVLLVQMAVMGFFALFFIIAILGTVFWVWMLVDCAQNEPSVGNDKVVWILVIVFTHFVGAVIYYFARRQPRLKSAAALPRVPGS